MINDGLPSKVRQNMSAQQVGAETLVYDEQRHQAFCLNRTSSSIWRMCDGTRTIANMAQGATLELGAPVSEELVRFALAELRRDGLVEAEFVPEAIAGVSRRSLMRTLGAGAMLLLPAIAVVAPLPAAAQYTGCFDCTATPDSGTATKAKSGSIVDQRKEEYKQLQKAKESQENVTDPFRLRSR